MKYLILLFMTLNTLAYNAIIRVHNAPILQIPDKLSRVLQYKRKGQKILLNKNTLNNPIYLETFTRDGSRGYIKREYVKVIYNDLRELENNITYTKKDPTNYLLSEPLPDNYPFAPLHNKRANIVFNYHVAHKSSYSYEQEKIRESANPSIAFELGLKRRPKFDLTDRIYYGFVISFQAMKNEYQLTSDIFTEETHANIGLGSTFSYTIYKEEFFHIDTNLKILANYQRTFVKAQDQTSDLQEELEFSGINFNGSTSIIFKHFSIFNSRKVSLMHGPGITMRLPYSFDSKDDLTNASLLRTGEYSEDLGVEYSYNIGISYVY